MMLPRSFRIGKNTIGSHTSDVDDVSKLQRCFVIAEAGVNHNGNPELAQKLIDAAIDAGADAVKFQTFNSDLLVQHKAESAEYQRRSGGGNTQLEMLTALELSYEALVSLAAYANKRGIVFFSTPFDEQSVDFLDQLGVPAFKIGSGDVTSTRLLKHVATKRKPVLLSTGMSFLNEVQNAAHVLTSNGVTELALFHCVSSYPAEAKDANLRAIETLRNTFKVPVGYSDHHRTNDIAIAAVARGAELIEKHLTLDNSLPGPDHSASLEPEEFKRLVTSIRDVCDAMGSGEKIPTVAEQECRTKGRRSIVSTRSIKLGERIEVSMLTNKRPASGIAPHDEGLVIGRIAATDIPEDTVLTWDMIKSR